jgi:UPF0755 protein
MPINKKPLLIGVGLLVLACLALGTYGYLKAFKNNIQTPDNKEAFLYLKNGKDMSELESQLQPYLKDDLSFKMAMQLKRFTQNNIKAGRYKIKPGMSNNQIINMLRSGLQSPVKVTFNNVRLPENLAAKIGQYLLCDSLCIYQTLADSAHYTQYGFSKETFMSMFIPNTYEVYWNTDPKVLLDKMKNEYDKFWNENRKNLAAAMNLTPIQVITLASIVQSETQKLTDAPIIAGVYVNRLDRGIPLQADPTLVFALKDFTIKRVLDIHKAVESPYNTYKYAGLPPGPICLPSPKVIDATLNYQKNNFIYFCAREDFSGYSNFAATLNEHNQNARKYQNALNNLNIRK